VRKPANATVVLRQSSPPVITAPDSATEAEAMASMQPQATPPRQQAQAAAFEAANPFFDSSRSPESHPPLDDWLRQPAVRSPSEVGGQPHSSGVEIPCVWGRGWEFQQNEISCVFSGALSFIANQQ